MKRKSNQRRRRERGMTLIEIMVVITILGLIASAVGVAVLRQLDRAKNETACNQIKDFDSALDIYKLEKGEYPMSDQGLQALVATGIMKAKKLPSDPWNHDYIYISPGPNNADSYDIYSKGSDGREGGEDPNNWGPPCIK